MLRKRIQKNAYTNKEKQDKKPHMWVGQNVLFLIRFHTILALKFSQLIHIKHQKKDVHPCY